MISKQSRLFRKYALIIEIITHLFQLFRMKKQGEKSQFQMYDQQLKMIAKQVEEDCPMVSVKTPIDNLQNQFINNEPFYLKIKQLKNQFKKYRRIRRDGNCFYRALVFNIFQIIIIQKQQKLRNHFLNKIKTSDELLKKAQFETFVYQDIQKFFIQKIQSLNNKSLDALEKQFNDPESNYYTLYLRFIVSSYLKINKEIYQLYIQAPSIDYFCQTEVQPIDRQADQVQIMALMNYLQIPIKIIYLDSNMKSNVPNVIKIPQESEQKKIKIFFLYRPGHYDLIYVK